MIDYITKAIKDFTTVYDPNIKPFENTKMVVENLLLNKNIYIEYEKNKGALIWILAPHHFNPNNIFAQELLLWIEPEYRDFGIASKLINNFEKKAKELGATHVVMSCLEAVNPKIVGKIYTNRGYRLTDYNYIKDI